MGATAARPMIAAGSTDAIRVARDECIAPPTVLAAKLRHDADRLGRPHQLSHSRAVGPRNVDMQVERGSGELGRYPSKEAAGGKFALEVSPAIGQRLFELMPDQRLSADHNVFPLACGYCAKGVLWSRADIDTHEARRDLR